MHRIPGLKCNHFGPPKLSERRAQFGRCVPQTFVVVVRDRVQSFELSADVHRLRTVEQLCHTRVFGVGGAKHRLRLRMTICTVDVLDVHHRQHHAFGIT